MTAVTLDYARSRIQAMDAIPTMPSILMPLVRCLEQPVESIELHRVVELISHDEGLAAQCLKIANSPLFARSRLMDTVRGAVVSLGLARVRDIALTCCMANMLPKAEGGFDPIRFWEHSLGTALICRRFSKRIGFRDPERTYLTGLLHDIGVIVNFQICPREFSGVYQKAYRERLSLEEVEAEVLGFTHSVSGELLGMQWKLSTDTQEVIRYHHSPSGLPQISPLLAITNIADILARTSGMDYGYPEKLDINLAALPSWEALKHHCPTLTAKDLTLFAKEIDGYAAEVRSLVAVLFRLPPG